MLTRFVNLRIVTDDGTAKPFEMVVDNGRIDSLAPAGMLTANAGEEWVDLKGALVLPGVIDGHVHFDDPGFTHREDFASGTAAAAAGGVTCVVDMPCTSMPPVTTAEALHHKVREIAGKAHVDFMLWGGISGNSMADRPWRLDLAEMAAEGAAAIKVYLLSGMDSFTDISPEQLADVMEAAAGSHLPVGVHAEDKAMVAERFERLHREGRDGAHAYVASRPAAVEIAAVQTVLEACRASGAPVHIVHLASGAALDEIAAARAEGWPVTAETCPHYLQFTTDDLARQGSILKTAPVVKDAADRDRLWQGLANGDLETVATDHAPAQWPEEKHTGSFWTDYGGIPGVELLLPYLYSEGVCRGRITLKRLVEVTAEGPARLFGLERRKGRLASGFDADFVVFDEALTWTVRAEALHNRNRYTPLEGETMTGRVRATYVRGRCVYRRDVDGSELFGPSGWGRYTPRGAA